MPVSSSPAQETNVLHLDAFRAGRKPLEPDIGHEVVRYLGLAKEGLAPESFDEFLSEYRKI